MTIKCFIEYSNNMVGIYKNIEEYNSNKKRKILFTFNDMIAVVFTNKKLNPIVTELFIRRTKLNNSLVFIARSYFAVQKNKIKHFSFFITESYFAVPKNTRLNSTRYFVMKIPNKWELQQIAFNHSSDIDFKVCRNLFKKCIAKPYSF